MGNFVIAGSKIKDLGVVNVDIGKMGKGKNNMDVIEKPVPIMKQEQVKKHRRHITQP